MTTATSPAHRREPSLTTSRVAYLISSETQAPPWLRLVVILGSALMLWALIIGSAWIITGTA